MLAVLANETSAITQFRLTQLLCYISPEERVAVEVKIPIFAHSQERHAGLYCKEMFLYLSSLSKNALEFALQNAKSLF